jgi:hypothetical protein
MDKMNRYSLNLFKKPATWVVIGLVFVAVVLYCYLLIFTPKSVIPVVEKKASNNNLKELVVSDVFVKQANNGQMLEEFPKGLIVDKDAVILASAESVTTSTSTRTFVTSYITKLTIEQLEKKYLEYTKANGFGATNNSNKVQGYLSIVALPEDFSESQSFKSFTVSTMKDPRNSDIIVMITYNTKK